MQGHRMPSGFGYKAAALWFTNATFQAVSILQESGKEILAR